MTIEFFPKLSQNYIELLEDNEYYDITIEVGEDPNVKIFRAHMNILCYRSPYLRQTLASNKKNDGSLSHVRLPNILPEIFQVILKYIYGGILSLNGQETSDILNVLVAADALYLQELVDYIQNYLIENKSKWMEENFEFILRVSSQSNNLLELNQFCTDLMAKFPEKMFKSLDFTSLSEKILVSLIKRDDLQMKEVEVWEYVLKWGLAKNPTLLPDPDTWSDDNFKIMKNTLQHCLPLIRFFCLSSIEFSQKVRPYKKLLNHQLYEDLLNSYLDPNRVASTDNISLPRNIKFDEIDSKIINLNIVSTISRCIDNIDINNNRKFANVRELYLPYKFQLLLRGSGDGFTPEKFHKLCDNKPKTVAFIKVKGTEEILGGYNPITWKSSKTWGKTKDSFIFSFDKINFRNVIISNVKHAGCALNYYHKNGPCFGNDLLVYVPIKSGGSTDEVTDYSINYCKNRYYEKRIRDTENLFSIEDYEVFQIVKI